MFEHMDQFLYRLRYFLVGVVVVTSLVLLTLLLSATVTAKGVEPTSGDTPMSVSDSPNAVTNGMSVAAYDFGRTIDSLGMRLNYGLRSTGSTISRSGQIVGNGLQTSASVVSHGAVSGIRLAGHGIKSSALFTVHTIGSGIAFVGHTAGSIIGFVSNTPVVSAVIKPAVSPPSPVIDPHSPTLYATKDIKPAAQIVSQSTPQPNEVAAWPIHGEITTQFGVPHWPYQPTHTGIDISDGQISGITGIKPFKPGRVTDTVRSGSGLGNHVVVDHGGGITSVYAHLASISVHVGQEVDKNTILGSEGSTGASTGTHLHFEIRVNGVPVNPLQYVNGQP